ncbi:MAG: acyl-CoA thioesterase [Bacteroidia bacterium]|nr:acyl-CoA thioesterase [Bacteroidia bacterium]
MFEFTAQRRVTYGETDKMGYLYYGHYAEYYETGRVEAFRSIGLVYKELEETGIIMPVLELHCNYHKPAFYDDMLSIRTMLPKYPDGVKLYFEYEIRNQEGTLLNTGNSTLIFFNVANRKPVPAAEIMGEKLAPFFT